MVIVIFHWKIHLHEDARRLFFDHWRDTLTNEERHHLVGEYLSKPLTADEASFPCVLMNVPPSAKYESYFNVGIWENLESFRQQIILPHVTSRPKTASFEYEYRDRMVLSPVSWRVGAYPLPKLDHFA